MVLKTRLYTYPSEHHLAVVLLSSVKRIIDESEASGSATTEFGLETENRNVLLLDLKGLGELGLDVSLGDVGQLGVNELNNLYRVSLLGLLTHCLLARRGFFMNLRAYRMNFLSAIFQSAQATFLI